MKIRNVVHKGFRRFIEDDNLASLQPAVIPKLRRILSSLQDMEREQQARRYWTAMLTVLDVTPPMVIATSTASPVGVSAGICTSTRYSPTEPGQPREAHRHFKAPDRCPNGLQRGGQTVLPKESVNS